MNNRLATILAQTTYDKDHVEVIDINVADPISSLMIRYSGRNTDAIAGTDHPAKCIPKIELVDGSDILYSANGHCAQGMDFYHRKREPNQWLQYLNDNYFDMVFNLNFGRFLFDPELALDPTKFGNLQLKVSIDLDAGGVEPDAGKLLVLGNLFDEKTISPTGFLMHKEMVSYTLATSAHEYIDLPTDYPYRKLFIRAQRLGTEPNQQIVNIKLSEDNDKRVIVNHDMQSILRSIAQENRPFTEYIVGQGSTSAQYFYCTPTQIVAGNVNTWATSAPTPHIFYHGDGGRFQVMGTAARNWIATVTGWMPHGMIEIPFGQQNVPEDWFDVRTLGSLRADITAQSSPGTAQTCEVLIQQLRGY